MEFLEHKLLHIILYSSLWLINCQGFKSGSNQHHRRHEVKRTSSKHDCKDHKSRHLYRTSSGSSDCKIRTGIPSSIQYASELRAALSHIISFEKLEATVRLKNDDKSVNMDLISWETMNVAGDYLEVNDCYFVLQFKDIEAISLINDVDLHGSCTGVHSKNDYFVQFRKKMGQEDVVYDMYMPRGIWTPFDLFDIVSRDNNFRNILKYPSEDGRKMFEGLRLKNAKATGAYNDEGFEFVMSGDIIEGQEISPFVTKVHSIVQFYKGNYSDAIGAILIDAKTDSEEIILKNFFGIGLSKLKLAKHILPRESDKILASVASQTLSIVNNLELNKNTSYHVTNATLEKVPKGSNVLYALEVKERFRISNDSHHLSKLPSKASFKMFKQNSKIFIRCYENITGTVDTIIKLTTNQDGNELAFKQSRCIFNQFIVYLLADRIGIQVNLTNPVKPVPGILELYELQLRIHKPTKNSTLKDDLKWQIDFEGKQQFLDDNIEMKIRPNQDVEGKYIIEGPLRVYNFTELLNRTGLLAEAYDSLYYSHIYDVLKNLSFMGLSFQTGLEESNRVDLFGESTAFGFGKERVYMNLFTDGSPSPQLFACYIAENVSLEVFTNSVSRKSMDMLSWLDADIIASCMLNKPPNSTVSDETFFFPGISIPKSFQDISKQELSIVTSSNKIPSCIIGEGEDAEDHFCMTLKNAKLLHPTKNKLQLSLKLSANGISIDSGSISQRSISITNNAEFFIHSPNIYNDAGFVVEGNLCFSNNVSLKGYIEKDSTNFARLMINRNESYFKKLFNGLPFIDGNISATVNLPVHGAILDYVEFKGRLRIGKEDAIVVNEVKILYYGQKPPTIVMYGKARIENLQSIVNSTFTRTSIHWLETEMVFKNDLLFTYCNRDSGFKIDGLNERIRSGCNFVGKAKITNKEIKVEINLKERQVDVTAYLSIINASAGNFHMCRSSERVEEGPIAFVRYYTSDQSSTVKIESKIEGFITTLSYSGMGALLEKKNMKYLFKKRAKMFDSVWCQMRIAATSIVPFDFKRVTFRYVIDEEDFRNQLNQAILRRTHDLLHVCHGINSTLLHTVQRAVNSAALVKKRIEEYDLRLEKLKLLTSGAILPMLEIARKFEVDCVAKCPTVNQYRLKIDELCLTETVFVVECLQWDPFKAPNSTCVAECEGRKAAAWFLYSKQKLRVEELTGKSRKAFSEKKEFENEVETIQLKRHESSSISSEVEDCTDKLSLLRQANETNSGVQSVQVEPIFETLNNVNRSCYTLNVVIKARVMGKDISRLIKLRHTSLVAETADVLFSQTVNEWKKIDCFANLQHNASMVDGKVDILEDAFDVDVTSGRQGKKNINLRRKIVRKNMKQNNINNKTKDFSTKDVGESKRVRRSEYPSEMPSTRSYRTWMAMNKFSPWTLYRKTTPDDLVSVYGDDKKPVSLRNNLDSKKRSPCESRRGTIKSLKVLARSITNVVHEFSEKKQQILKERSDLLDGMEQLLKNLQREGREINASKSVINDMTYWAREGVKGMRKLHDMVGNVLDAHNSQAIPILRREIANSLEMDGLGRIDSYINTLENSAQESAKRSKNNIPDFESRMNSVSRGLKHIMGPRLVTVEEASRILPSVIDNLDYLSNHVAECYS